MDLLLYYSMVASVIMMTKQLVFCDDGILATVSVWNVFLLKLKFIFWYAFSFIYRYVLFLNKYLKFTFDWKFVTAFVKIFIWIVMKLLVKRLYRWCIYVSNNHPVNGPLQISGNVIQQALNTNYGNNLIPQLFCMPMALQAVYILEPFTVDIYFKRFEGIMQLLFTYLK